MLKWNFQRNRTLVPEGFSKAISLVATVATKDDVLKISSFPLCPQGSSRIQESQEVKDSSR
jgi:hypothetical protein